MKTPLLNSLSKTKDTKILKFLKTVPHLDFSKKGVENISKRFAISQEHLQRLINEVLRKGGRNV